MEKPRLAFALEAFYRSGALVFGGGHVVLPLLSEAFVTPGWVSDDAFLAGYGSASGPRPSLHLRGLSWSCRPSGRLSGNLGDLPSGLHGLCATGSISAIGHDRHSVCRQHHEFSVKALEGTIPTDASDSWFAYIATIDDGDDWTDPAVWIKANPSLGVTVKVEDLKRQIDEAREMPAQQNAIRRLRLNEWTEQVTRWLDMAVWEEGGPPAATDWRTVKEELDDLAEMLAGRTCYGGLDLARVNDLSAFVLLFSPTGDEDLGALADKWIALCRFWVPEEDILRRARRDRVPYDVWRDQKFLVATRGNATDFAFIEREILDLAAFFDLREVAYDRTFAGEIVQNLQDEGVKLVEFGQDFLSLAAPTAELERLAVSRALWHGGHPVLRWNASNVAVRQDPPATSSRTRRSAGRSCATAAAAGPSTRTRGWWFL